jgi:hypothetical protein
MASPSPAPRWPATVTYRPGNSAQSVVKQIAQHLTNPLGINVHEEILRQVSLHRHPLGLRPGADCLDGSIHYIGQGHRLAYSWRKASMGFSLAARLAG